MDHVDSTSLCAHHPAIAVVRLLQAMNNVDKLKCHTFPACISIPTQNILALFWLVQAKKCQKVHKSQADRLGPFFHKLAIFGAQQAIKSQQDDKLQ
jgi:hypothetical protein